MTRSLEQLHKDFLEFVEKLDPKTACAIVNYEEDQSSCTLLIEPRQPSYCGVLVETYESGFDITLGDLITESDVSHEDVEVTKIVEACALGNIQIYVEKFRNITVEKGAEVVLQDGNRFYSRQLSFWFPIRFRQRTELNYKSMMRSSA